MFKCGVIIVAAGAGLRVGSPLPKQYLEIGGQSVLAHSVKAFMTHPKIDVVQVVIGQDHQELYAKAVQGVDLPSPVLGGDTRQTSVLNGLESLAKNHPDLDYVMIHDAARPFIKAEEITAIYDALAEHQAVLAATPLVDTLKRTKNGLVTETIDRTDLFLAQTPQAFHFDKILQAHRQYAGLQLTDDAAVAEKAKIPVFIVPTSAENFKITHPSDVKRARSMLHGEPRV